MAPVPPFCDPGRVGTLFYPDVADIAAHAAGADLKPASRDREKIHLLIVDMQVDFCHPKGTLYVPGAPDDIRRLLEFIYRQAERITGITCSLDSHLPHQIFHPSWWEDAEGHSPEPFTIITSADVDSGRWRPRRQKEWSATYLRTLQQQSSKELVIWPYHVLIGGLGNMLDGELWSAVFWHSLARRSQPTWWRKGSDPGTEHYSILRPEVPVPGSPGERESAALLKMLQDQDYLIIAGEAASHCVMETLEDLVAEFQDQPAALERIFVLKDCTSPVQHPEIDFASLTRKQFARFEEAGIRFIQSGQALPF